MIEKVIIGEDPQRIVDQFFDLINHRSGLIMNVQSLIGVSVNKKIDISDDIAIVPSVGLPITFERERIFGLDRWNHMMPKFVYDWPLSYPSSAIINCMPWNYILEKYEYKNWFSKILPTQLFETSQNISYVIAALTIATNGAPTKGWSYFAPMHPAFGYRSLGQSSGGILSDMFPAKIALSDAKDARQAYQMLRKLPTTVWDTLSISIERLRRSRYHPDPVNRAIDLGIAIESALLYGELGSGAKGELRSKVATRGAWLIEEHPNCRIRTYNTLTKAYDARSSAVHAGRLKSESMDTLVEADEICRRIIWELAKRDRYPDWKKLTLGLPDL